MPFDIITLISQLPDISVPARSSTFRYKDKAANIREIGKELKVRHVLEGSIQRAGDRLRVTAQLIDAKTGNHVWSERYDLELTDTLAVQDEIGAKILAALQTELAKSNSSRSP